MWVFGSISDSIYGSISTSYSILVDWSISVLFFLGISSISICCISVCCSVSESLKTHLKKQSIFLKNF